jgi:hypothetical protein
MDITYRSELKYLGIFCVCVCVSLSLSLSLCHRNPELECPVEVIKPKIE